MRKFSTVGALAVAVTGGSMVAVPADADLLRYRGSGDWTQITDGASAGWGLNPNNDGVTPGTSLPGAADDARINFGGNTVTVTSSVPTTNSVQIGVDESGTVVVNDGGVLTTNSLRAGNNNAAATGTLNVNSGGVVNVNGIFWTARDAGVTGNVNINTGGTVNVASHLWWGVTGTATVNITGTLSQTGGILGLGTENALTPSGGTATVTIGDGGSLILNNISSAVGLPSIQAGSLIDITETGQILLEGDFVGVLNDYVDAGKIVGDGTLGNVNVSIIDIGGTDFTQAIVPEPASLMLVGIGATAMLIRRKRA
jgi:hypothetical protein